MHCGNPESSVVFPRGPRRTSRSRWPLRWDLKGDVSPLKPFFSVLEGGA